MSKPKIKTIAEIRNELTAGLLGIASITFVENMAQSLDRGRYQQTLNSQLQKYIDSLVERAIQQFEAGLADRERQLKLGELADQFFQAIKLGEQNHGGN